MTRLNKSTKPSLSTKSLKTWLQNYGHDQKDLRLNRQVRFMSAMCSSVPYSLLPDSKPIMKYKSDWKRMKKSFDIAVRLAKKDPDSRRLVVYNTQDSLRIQPCFLIIQFVRRDGEYDVITYMRSSDVSKLDDDIVFFSEIINRFKKQTKAKIRRLILMFGHVHYDTT